MLDLVSKKNMRWDSLETYFFELVSILSFLKQKKKVFLHWVQIGETLVLFFSYNGSQKCLSQRSDWEGPFPSLWWVHWRSFKKKKKRKVQKKKKLFKFLSFGFKLEKLWFFPFRTMARKRHWKWCPYFVQKGNFTLTISKVGSRGLERKRGKHESYREW